MAMIWKWDSTENSAVNLNPAASGNSAYYLKETLKQAGWVVKSSSDATTYNSTGDQITQPSTGAGGIANNNSWWRIQSPAGASSKEFTFQYNTGQWRVKFSHSAGFSGGSPSASQTPSATDEQLLLGAGTDAAPTFATFFSTNGTYKLHIGADNAAPYGFYMICPSHSTDQFPVAMYLLPLTEGSYAGTDDAPYVVSVKSTFGGGASITDHTTGAGTQYGIGYSYARKGLPNEAWLLFAGANYTITSGSIVNKFAFGDLYSGARQLLPILVGRGTSYMGIKGFIDPDIMAWRTEYSANSDYVDIGTKRYVLYSNLAFRWPPGVRPIL
jgi:hypothetical protein